MDVLEGGGDLQQVDQKLVIGLSQEVHRSVRQGALPVNQLFQQRTDPDGPLAYRRKGRFLPLRGGFRGRRLRRGHPQQHILYSQAPAVHLLSDPGDPAQTDKLLPLRRGEGQGVGQPLHLFRAGGPAVPADQVVEQRAVNAGTPGQLYIIDAPLHDIRFQLFGKL